MPPTCITDQTKAGENNRKSRFQRFLTIPRLSFGGRDEQKDHDEWFIVQYEWQDDDRFRMRLMDVKVVGDDVRAGRIKGRVEERAKKRGNGVKGSEDTHPPVEIQEPT